MKNRRAVVERSRSGGVARYLNAPFIRMLTPDTEEGGYIAEVLELPGCISQGDSPEEAYRNLDDAMGTYIEVLLERGRPIPEPVGDKEYSGHFPLRMSSEMHRSAALRAFQEGISLNQWVVNAIATRLAGQTLGDEVAEKLRTVMSVRLSAAVEVSQIVTSQPPRWESQGEPRLIIEGERIRSSEKARSLPTPTEIITAKKELD